MTKRAEINFDPESEEFGRMSFKGSFMLNDEMLYKQLKNLKTTNDEVAEQIKNFIGESSVTDSYMLEVNLRRLLMLVRHSTALARMLWELERKNPQVMNGKDY